MPTNCERCQDTLQIVDHITHGETAYSEQVDCPSCVMRCEYCAERMTAQENKNDCVPLMTADREQAWCDYDCLNAWVEGLRVFGVLDIFMLVADVHATYQLSPDSCESTAKEMLEEVHKIFVRFSWMLVGTEIAARRIVEEAKAVTARAAAAEVAG